MRLLPLTVALAFGLTGPVFAQTIERILETGELKLGFRTDAPPLSFADEKGDAAGYSPLLCVGIAQALAKNLELEDLAVSFHPVTTEDQFEKVASGEIDLLCGATTITLDRREMVDFSIPTYVDGSVVLLPRNANPTFKDLEGKKIGVHRGTTTAEALENSLAQNGIHAEEVLFDSHDAGIEALKNKEIDAYFGDQSILLYYLIAKDLGSDLRITDRLLSLEKQGLAMARGDANFRLVVDGIISSMYRTGGMQRLYREALPGVEPGQAMKALHLIAPELP
ncbi:MAG: amino acid ABC transporter substrate-binding protein [Tropicimonas sp.]|uniref:amino acid ABC transporter substrate-binding protein n=1 Tax=Tropicimonas sp. TaxID=2067044 RepID=UPI003A878B87